jgi:anti-sigma regulatory factor (Ser/Thr protein kinase)
VARPEYALRPAPLQLTRPKLLLSGVGDLRSLRIDLYPLLLASPLSRKEVDDFVKAVGEVVDNAHRHGSGRVDVRLWSGSAATICTVSDQGSGMDDPFMGYARPAAAAETGPSTDRLGLWAARQLCDTLDYSRTPTGFTVRLTVSHRAGGPGDH